MTSFETTTWKSLLAFLATLGHVEQIAPGKITIAPAGSARTLEIVMTPTEWVEMTSVMWGNVRDAAEDVKRSVLGAAETDRFLIYNQYRLEPSPTAHRAPDPGLERLDRLLRDNDGKTSGSWFAHDPEGRSADRFSDFPDTPSS